MLSLYRKLLYLYPGHHRREFGEEMLAVFQDVWAENKGFVTQTLISIREFTGILKGALREHLRQSTAAPIQLPLSHWRFTMRNGFRFPKSTAILMTLILAGVVLAIKRGEDIANSLPPFAQPVAPIHPMHITLLSPIVVLFVGFWIAGLIGGTILFALRRSSISPEQK
jgi:hypothetical protein